MTDPQAFKGDYVDLKFIKSRKVAQIWIEIPIEEATQFVADFGAPSPAFGIPVALARLDLNAKPELKGGKLCQRAGILCTEGAFVKFLAEHVWKKSLDECDPFDPSVTLRIYCDVTSRRELDHNEEAAKKFIELEASYRAWLTQ